MESRFPPRFFEQIRMFIVAANSQNFLEAARSLSVSQAALSLHLRELERTVGAPLFVLKGRKKELSHLGLALSLTAESILNNSEREISRCLNQFRSEENLILRVGTRPELFAKLAAGLKFKGRVRFLALSGVDAATALLEKRIDLAVTHQKPDSSELVAKRAFESGLIFVWKETRRRLSNPHDLDADWLASVPAISVGPQGDHLKSILEEKGLNFSELPRQIVVDDWRSVLEILSGLPRGYAVIPQFLADRTSGLQTHALANKPILYHYLYARDLKKIEGYRRVIESLSMI